MPVRNLRGLGSTKPLPVFTWIPPLFSPISKIIVTDGTTEYDVTDLIIEGQYTYGVTETIGNFEFVIDNSTEQYTEAFSLWDELKVYLDYGVTATTLKFVGRIERASKKDHKIVIVGRSSAVLTLGKNVTYQATETARSEILTAIIEKYFSGVITTNNIEEDSGLITVNYFDVPFWEVVEDICKSGGFDAYIDTEYDFHYFESGSRLNETDMVVHTANLIETNDFSSDLEQVYNRVKVYGASSGDVPIIATAEDESSISQFKIKELKIDDGSITSVEQAQARADYELSLQVNPPTIGTIRSLLLPTISPGEMIYISDPQNGLDPNFYQIHKFTHFFSNDEPPFTELTVQKERLDIPNILKKRIKVETGITANINPNEMDYSIVFDFKTNTGDHSNTEINTDLGILKTDGSSSGTWTSPVITTSSNVTDIEPRISGSKIEGVRTFISLNGGQSFVEARYNQTSFSEGNVGTIPDGNQVRLRIEIPDADTEITSAGILYKRE